eukprot:1866049-Lingulodinium_polyedra.AAC.1
MRAARTVHTPAGVSGGRPKPAAAATVRQMSNRDWRPATAEAANFARRNAPTARPRRPGSPAMSAASRLEPL